MNTRTPSPTVLLHLRWLQLRRAWPFYGAWFVAVAALGVWTVVRTAVEGDVARAPYIAAGTLLVVWGLHQRRPDLPFLHRHVPQARLALLLEYAALVMPVLLALLLTSAWAWSAVLVLACAVPWVPVVRVSSARGSWLRKRMPVQLFEWRSLVQSTHPWGLVLWLAALVLCWLPLLPLFFVGIVVMMAVGAQEQCEPRTMLLATAPTARDFLRRKLLGSAGLTALIVLPVVVGATVFKPAWWWIHGLFGFGMVVLVAYAVVLKYAHYRPNDRLTPNGVNTGIALVFAILPGLSLVPLLMLLSELRNARTNLNTYFDAHHH